MVIQAPASCHPIPFFIVSPDRCAKALQHLLGSLKLEFLRQDTCTQEKKPAKTRSENVGTQLFE
jgi:hypothetical protein